MKIWHWLLAWKLTIEGERVLTLEETIKTQKKLTEIKIS